MQMCLQINFATIYIFFLRLLLVPFTFFVLLQILNRQANHLKIYTHTYLSTYMTIECNVDWYIFHANHDIRRLMNAVQ